MTFDYSFRGIDGTNTISSAVDFLAAQSLGYPNYAYWVEKAETEMRLGIKGGVIAYNNGRIAGDVVYQPHKSLLGIVELKNIRIHPEVRGRRFASFMLRQAELESRGNLFLVDTRRDQMDMVRFLLSEGYSPIASIPLYEEGVDDVVFAKFPNGDKTKHILELESYFRLAA